MKTKYSKEYGTGVNNAKNKLGIIKGRRAAWRISVKARK